ncbi:MAG: DNA polymerase I [Alphaproteobacteria bacterium]|nr:DNA polymerase I [Alphaproteobacteria bacterium]
MLMSEKFNETLYLVDASGFIFRAFHALPPLTDPKGTPVGAVLGFTNMLIRLLTDLKARHVGVIFDAARRNFRNEIYPDYKANRDETPPDLIPQFPLIREATRAFGFEPLEVEGYEADDLIAAYARQGRDKGLEVVIVSSDKDLMQLIRDGVSMYDPLKQRAMGAPEVMEKFGVTPDKVIEVQALIGDPTDNVPGVRGIGPKTAAELINEYGDLEGLLANLDKIKQPKRRETLVENAELARLSKKLVTLDAHAPIPRPLEALGAGSPASPELVSFLQSHGFKSVLSRLGAKPEPIADTAAPMPTVVVAAKAAPTEAVYVTITDARTLEEWVREATAKGVVSVDTETTALTPAKAELVGISLSHEEGRGAYIPVGHRNKQADLLGDSGPEIVQMKKADAIRILKPLLEDPSVMKIGQNIKYDIQMFAHEGVAVTPIDDTMLISYAVDGSAHGHGMDELAELHLGYKTILYSDVAGKGAKQISFAEVPVDAATKYAAEDADITLRLYNHLKPRLAQARLLTVYETMDRPLAPVIARMESHGVKVDVGVLRSLSSEFGARLITLEGEIHKLAGTQFNVASPKQLGEILFGQMGLPSGKKTKTGDWSTSADILEELAEQGHEIVEKVLDYRQMAKLKSTYTDALQEEICKRTGRVHTSFALAHTSTGRLASTEPNLQNIPIRTDAGKKIREAFVAEDGYVLLSIDYSQIELRLAAALGGIPALQRAFREGLDIHAMTASEVFGIPMEEMTPDVRRRAKAINFGIIYGISSWGLAKQLGITPQEAGSYIKQYFARFPELSTYMERTKEEARKHGHVNTFFGRRCIIDGINDKNPARRGFAERQAINAPLQGTAADIMRKAMIRVDRALEANRHLDCKMLLQVHDELVFEVKAEQAQEAAALVKSIMESVADVGVPLVAEAGIGPNWAKAH